MNTLGTATISVVNTLAGRDEAHPTPAASILPIEKDLEYQLPENTKDRLDLLILGIRGVDDTENGGLLTDTILLLTIDAVSNRASLVSIPRDLTVRITDTRVGKINTLFAHYGVSDTKEMYSRILGVGIDNIVVADFDAFISVIDTLGGITVTLDRPFQESQQWGFPFSLPAGRNELNAQQALYYSRSRYSSNDFDRSRRQMQVLMAIKEKVAALSLANEPLKALSLVTTIRKHITTDLNVLDLGTIKNLLSQQQKLSSIRRFQITTENLLYETTRDGVYELLPRDGTLSHLQTFTRTLTNATPILPTPEHAAASASASVLHAPVQP